MGDFVDDVTKSYEDWVFSFEENGYASLRIPNENLFLEGGWEVYENFDVDNDGDQTSTIEMYMYFFHPTLDDFREFYWCRPRRRDSRGSRCRR